MIHQQTLHMTTPLIPRALRINVDRIVVGDCWKKRSDKINDRWIFVIGLCMIANNPAELAILILIEANVSLRKSFQVSNILDLIIISAHFITLSLCPSFPVKRLPYLSANITFLHWMTKAYRSLLPGIIAKVKTWMLIHCFVIVLDVPYDIMY